MQTKQIQTQDSIKCLRYQKESYFIRMGELKKLEGQFTDDNLIEFTSLLEAVKRANKMILDLKEG